MITGTLPLPIKWADFDHLLFTCPPTRATTRPTRPMHSLVATFRQRATYQTDYNPTLGEHEALSGAAVARNDKSRGRIATS
jgi:hypothetical protein